VPSFLSSTPPPPPSVVEPLAGDVDEDDDAPPPFPLLDSHQRSSVRAPASATAFPPPPPPPSFTVTAPPASSLRDPLEFTDDDFNYDSPPLRQTKAKTAPEAGLVTPTTTTKVVKTREKVALEPGHSALDWSRVQKSGMWQGVPLRVRHSLSLDRGLRKD
jgi:hypothetical protein